MTHPAITHGFHHMQGKPEYKEEEERCHLCQVRNFATAKDGYNVAIINEVNDEWIDPDFRFIDQYVDSKDVAKSRAPKEALSGCECKNDIYCAHDKCGCLEDLDPSNIINTSYKNAYYTTGERKGLLREEVLELSNNEIYECSDRCTCSKNCPNRVVGHGRKVNLEIFRTGDGRGWGVRPREDVRKGQFIDKYVGEIITPAEANRRREEATDKSKKDLYLFGLDKFNNPEAVDPSFRGDPYEVDGEFISGPTRFVNHSCDPNLRIMAVVTNLSEKHLHELCFFALEDIPRFTELTFDYTASTNVQEDEEAKEQQLQEKLDSGAFLQTCLCGSDNCRGYLWSS